MSRTLVGICLFCLVGLACSLTTDSHSAPTTAPIGLTSLPIRDGTSLLDSTCFDGLLSLDGYRLVVEDQVVLDQVYNLLDTHCPEPMQRGTLDFGKEVLVIAAQVAQACDARLDFQRLENNQLMLQFSKTGTCGYQVVALYVAILPRPASSLQVNVIGA